MESAAIMKPVVQPNLYCADGPALGKDAVWQRLAPLQLPRQGYAAVKLQKEDDWNNGDPPDLMLWGEEL